MTGCWAVIPAKNIKEAKSRLQNALSPIERNELVLCLLGRVLSAVVKCSSIQHYLVVTRDPLLSQFAVNRGAEVIWDKGPGLNGALFQGCAEVRQGGGSSVLIIPSDLPWISAEAINEIVNCGENNVSNGIVLVPSLRKDGTNALYIKPPDLFKPSFGFDSFSRHLERASNLGIKTIVLESKAIGFDLDSEEDLIEAGGLHNLRSS